MSHPLDRPVWNALISRQADLARGDARALRFDPDYGQFAACADPRDTQALLGLTGGGIGVVEAADTPFPPELSAHHAICNQMIASAITPGTIPFDIVALDDDDAAEMLALATLTRPGPFFRHTNRLGDFIGVKIDGRLVAMAGERMKPEGFTEVSGVCTHPDFRGRGYAGSLMRLVAQKIIARGETPFLHVYADNKGAIVLYEALGFRFRAVMHYTVLTAQS
ncbi:MAG: GNAT family N-acetyltransferase [Rhizomicrobium sp.]